jgi:uncharacterized MAPEG superfamily protein
MLLFGPGAGTQDFVGGAKKFKSIEHEQHVKANEMRAIRSAANDHENIPITLILSWGSLLCSPNTAVHIAALSVFTAARTGFTVSYMKGLQPARTIFWGLGFAGTFTIAVNGLIGALRM